MPHRNALLACLTAALVLLAVPLAHAAGVSDEEELTRFGGEGSAAGQLTLFPGYAGIATDPVTGHVYVVDSFNNRIDEFTPWGAFVKAFGWDVAPAAVNEQQEVRVRAAGGEFKLAFGAGGPGVAETGGLAFNASAAEVKAALDGLTNVSAVGGSVGVEANPGSADGKSPTVYVIAFKGSLAAKDVAQITATNGPTPLGGGSPSTALEASTRADGTPGGSGLESCTAESGCQGGLQGSGAGQLNDARSIAVDAAGGVYVREVGNHRVQKFNSAGRFVLMFGGEVNKTKTTEGKPEAERNRCTAAQLEAGNVCGAGTVGTGPGQFGNGVSSGIAPGPPGEIFVGDEERFQRFNLQGEYEAQAPVPGETIYGFSFDPIGGGLYVTFNGKAGVHKLDSTTGSEIGLLTGQTNIATDAAGNLFATGTHEVLEYDATGKPLSPASCCEAERYADGSEFFPLTAIGTNAVGDIYVAYSRPTIDSFIRSFGPGPVSFESQPSVPPEISEQFAASVERDGGILGALINPHFWKDTRYYVQYGTGKCSEGGCAEVVPVPPGTLLTSKQIGQSLRATVSIAGLSPGTTYHYRFVAKSGGGGPVYGQGGGTPETVGGETVFREVGEESSFTTFEPLAPRTCPNDALRTGPAARLPDCRGYEMVSPLDKSNGDIRSVGFTELEESAADGEKFSYSSYRAFAHPESAPYTNQYFARRDPQSGWQSKAITPGLAPPPNNINFVTALNNPFKDFSPDLCTGWFVAATEPRLDPAHDFAGYPNVYRRDFCGGGADEALIPVKPSVAAREFYPEPQGASADGTAVIVRAQMQTGGPWQAYYASGGEMRFLCVLPDGTPVAGNCSGGTSGDTGLGLVALGRMANVAGAISADGSKAYWTDSGAKQNDSGKVYLRLNPGQPESAAKNGQGACVPEAERACTEAVSTTKTPLRSRFLAASEDGAKALFQVVEGPIGGNLYEFTLGASATKLAGKVVGLAGASKDLSRIYFVSEEALAGGQLGKPNLYLDDEGALSLIATLSSTDVSGEIPTDTAAAPVYHAARVTPDGSALAFISTAKLTGYDNTDLASGEADSEVYRYEVGAAGPVCVSCNPSGARPLGRAVQAPLKGALSLPTAASIPLASSELHDPRALSGDGSRLFFNSYDALLPRDTNGKADVYEWEAGASQGACEEMGAELYVASSGGCLSLISSGESSQDSLFADASESGDDAFFTTNASLIPRDSGLIDVYDARVGGGFPEPSTAAACEGEACQGTPAAPNDPTPASSAFEGTGNVREAPRASCRKGQVRRKGRCASKKKHRRAHHRAAGHSRGAGR